MAETPPFDIAAGERLAHQEEIHRLRTLSDRERGLMIKSACRSAVQIYAGRLRSGLPPYVPEPWPASTWEFLRQQAKNVRRS